MRRGGGGGVELEDGEPGDWIGVCDATAAPTDNEWPVDIALALSGPSGRDTGRVFSRDT